VTRVCVAGVGVIGSLFAGFLARVADVSALTRREEHALALNEGGLRVSGRADFTSRITASTRPGSSPAALARPRPIDAARSAAVDPSGTGRAEPSGSVTVISPGTGRG